MKTLNLRTSGRIAAVLGVAAMVGSCTTDKLIYQQVPSNVPTAAKSFVGYTDQSTKQTGCGNCHVEQQAGWAQTRHASAWLDLQASGGAGPECVACHSVSKNGNGGTVDSVGYIATNDPRYQDVQCESCHGAGLQHMTAPTLLNHPLASVNVDTTTTAGCGACHKGTHEPFVNQWEQTSTMGHAHVETAALSSATCQSCHTAQGALLKFNVTTNYVERDSVATHPEPIVCVVCHDPHSPDQGHQLRYAINTPDPTLNLCMQCHNRDAAASPTSTHGPMSAETATLLGTAGWWPPNLMLNTPDTILATHGSAANTNMCATCHVVQGTITSKSTGAFVFQNAGHNFAATPCLDSLAEPTTASCTFSQRSFAACTASGCHGTAAVAASLYVNDSIQVLALETTLTNQLAKVPASALASSTTLTTAKGARWNLQLAQKTGAFVHNPFLIEALLAASIKQITTDYGVPANSVISVEDILARRNK